MEGVTTALVAFIFFCVIFPDRVKNRTQFYAALLLICLIILLDALGLMISGPEVNGGRAGFRVFAYVAEAFLQVCAILTLFMAAGGISWNDLKDEMGNAIEVIRRGESKKEVIIPLTGQVPKRTPVEDSPVERIPLDEPDKPLD